MWAGRSSIQGARMYCIAMASYVCKTKQHVVQQYGVSSANL